MLDIYVIDKYLNMVGLIDNYSSAIFTRRYWECGDFELYIQADSKSLELLQPNYYVQRSGESTLYVVENIQLDTSSEDGDFLTVSGRSIESMLDRRVLYNHRNAGGSAGGFMVSYPIAPNVYTVEDCIRHAMEMTIAPSNLNDGANYDWDGFFRLGARHGYTEQIEATQLYGENLYDFVTSQCQLYGYGFKAHLRSNEKYFEFNLYQGRDCSYNQTDNPYIVFSPNFDNLSNTTYTYTSEGFKNTVLVAGEGDGDERRWNMYGIVNGSGTGIPLYINRRETFFDGSSLSSEGVDDYMALLKSASKNELLNYKVCETMDGDTIQTTTDYQLGDIVQIENEYGIQATARILEIIECEDESGYSIVPTFSTWEVQ